MGFAGAGGRQNNPALNIRKAGDLSDSDKRRCPVGLVAAGGSLRPTG